MSMYKKDDYVYFNLQALGITGEKEISGKVVDVQGKVKVYITIPNSFSDSSTPDKLKEKGCSCDNGWWIDDIYLTSYPLIQPSLLLLI